MLATSFPARHAASGFKYLLHRQLAQAVATSTLMLQGKNRSEHLQLDRFSLSLSALLRRLKW
jgi:hypothetical protein